jgi:hypothetical protein
LDFWVSKHADNIAKVHLENKIPKFLAMSMWQPTVVHVMVLLVFENKN